MTTVCRAVRVDAGAGVANPLGLITTDWPDPLQVYFNKLRTLLGWTAWPGTTNATYLIWLRSLRG
ncbi:hypothetical protein [Streptomyces sp. NPDC051132]|uniref:hypothetical protein n=1 Tax=unclassified Streptomyces TaxID=2593676 RepID=UPI00341252F8